MTETLTLDNKVRQVVSNIRNLPTPPIVFHQIQKVLSDPDVSAAQVANILAEDPAMSVKVLKLTNSSFYGLSRTVDSVKQAIVIVGLEAVKNLVLSAAVLDMFKGSHVDADYQERFWRHSLATGFCARLLARQIDGTRAIDPEGAFSAGLLHDVGKLVLGCFLTEEAEVLRQQREAGDMATDVDLENRELGYNHAQVGGCLAEIWKLPPRLIEAITYHHSPHTRATDDIAPAIVHIANHLAKLTFYEKDDRWQIGDLQPGACDEVGIKPKDLDDLCDHLKQEYLKAETFMQMVGLH